MKSTRAEVYAALDSERAYQESRWNATTTTSEGKHSLSEWIAYMEDYLAEAKHLLARVAKQTAYPDAVHIIRKVTTMGVAAMEEHGAPQRVGFERQAAPSGLWRDGDGNLVERVGG